MTFHNTCHKAYNIRRSLHRNRVGFDSRGPNFEFYMYIHRSPCMDVC